MLPTTGIIDTARSVMKKMQNTIAALPVIESCPNLSHQKRIRMAWGKISRRKSDILFSQYVRLKQGKCERCFSPVRFNDNGMPVSHDLSHFKGRRREITRFDEDNCSCLCKNCHRHLGENPDEHRAWMLKRLGEKRYNALVLRSSLHKKRDDAMDIITWKAMLKDIIQQK